MLYSSEISYKSGHLMFYLDFYYQVTRDICIVFVHLTLCLKCSGYY